MNKIIIDNGEVNSLSSKICINDNVICFNESGDYKVEYNGNNNSIIYKIENVNVNLIECCFDMDVVNNIRYDIKNGVLNVNKFYNALSVNENIDINLYMDNDTINYNFSNICRVSEKYIININHLCKNTNSNINNKSVALKNSVIDFVINSNVSKDCNGSILNQNTRIITMDDCVASIKPNMFIDLDDVSAKHGSVIGTFKDDQIFYLMSKGISYNDSIKLLIKGYILGNIEVDYELRQLILDIINRYWR